MLVLFNLGRPETQFHQGNEVYSVAQILSKTTNNNLILRACNLE